MLVGLAGAVLSGCVPNLGIRPQPIALQSLNSEKSLDAPTTPWPEQDWWRGYGDAQLDALEAEALAGSPDLRVADARSRRAAAAAEQAGAATLPELGANAHPELLRQSRNLGYPDFIKDSLPSGIHSQGRLTLDLAFDLDFFGRNRAALAAATSEAQAAAIDAAAARLHLSASVASSYAELVRLFEDRAAAFDALRVRRETLDLITQRFSQGLSNRVDRDQQATTVPISEGDLAAIDHQILVARLQIAALLGAGPDRGLAIGQPAAVVLRAYGIPATIRLDLVGRRPDLVAARRRVEAAGHRIDSARAEFYPNVNLTAFAGFQSFGIASLFTNDALIGSAGPAISLPIFSGGRVEGAYRVTRASYEEAVATYDRMLADALRDVAGILSGQRSLRDQVDDAQRALASATAADDGTRQRYAAGLATYLDVLTTETAIINQRRTLADLRGQFLALDIDLVRALGGGFADPQLAKN